MRLRVGAVLCLFLGFIGAGCRKTLVPSTLDNQPPETWIVAAPQDTITTRDDSNTPVRPRIGQIPVRFHLYWAGADRDGSVGGYFWAVVETLPVPMEGSNTVPSLPGPKARDYHYTTKTDSIFIFTASEEVSERQHAFYVYAVDDKGRPDPTPARFVFSSYDKYPPKAIIDEFKAVGTEYELLPTGGVRAQRKTYFVTDFFEISNDHASPRDTVPADAFLTVRWHGEPTIPSTVVTGYRYKLDETDFNSVDSSVHTATYNTGVGLDKVNPGPKIFTLRAIGQSGWRGEATRWFQMNFAPDTWFAGPDLNDPLAGWQTFTDANNKRYWFMDFASTGWAAFQGVPGTMLSDDSVNVLPALRPQRKTFFEIYNDRLWMHAENDTVHLNSWVIIPTGGFDRDSPYAVRVNRVLLPAPLVGTPVLTPDGPNGSPIGFRLRIPVKDAGGQVSQPSENTTYPEFDPASVKNQPIINGVQGMTTAGRAFAEVFAEDGNTTVDRRITQRPRGSVGIVERVEAGTADAEDIALRSKILTFYVNKAPRLKRDGTFKPTVNQLLNRTLSGTSRFQIPAEDEDQLDPTTGFNPVGGTPSYGPILRRKIAILGKYTGTTRDTCYVIPEEWLDGTSISPQAPIPDWIATGNIIVRIRLCDCVSCDVTQGTATCPFGPDRGAAPGYGTCVETDIPARLAATEPAGIPTGDASTLRPGSAVETGRRKQ
jgi:hypothetical protein